jgi:hypothetical protein
MRIYGKKSFYFCLEAKLSKKEAKKAKKLGKFLNFGAKREIGSKQEVETKNLIFFV